jgi:hypothetical protein
VKKIAQSVKIYTSLFPWIKVPQTFGLLLKSSKNIPNKTIAREAKIRPRGKNRPFWSPWRDPTLHPISVAFKAVWLKGQKKGSFA